MAKVVQGTVISAKMDKSLVVRVERKFRHPVYRKVITKHKKFTVHNDLKGIKSGDVVVIQETAPISKNKHFIAVEKVTK